MDLPQARFRTAERRRLSRCSSLEWHFSSKWPIYAPTRHAAANTVRREFHQLSCLDSDVHHIEARRLATDGQSSIDALLLVVGSELTFVGEPFEGQVE